MKRKDIRSMEYRSTIRHFGRYWRLACAGVAVFGPPLGVLSAQGAHKAPVLELEQREHVLNESIQKTVSPETRVSLGVRDSSVLYVVRSLVQQARLRLSVDADNPLFNKRIDARVTNVPVMEALKMVLVGTGLEATLLPDGETVVVRRWKSHDTGDDRRAGERQGTGQLKGTVTDSATGEAITGVAVTVQGAELSTTTDSKGVFTISGVPAGEQTVVFKALGYAQVVKAVTIADGKPTSVRVLLRPAANILAGVVTTATGEQRKIEVGHSVTTINVDSVMQVAPISSMTDLLESRVPGLSVQRTSGTPGDPSRLRLHGTSSLYANNDPIIVVDGVRMYSEQSDERNTNVSGGADRRYYATPSPLDQIDPNIVEKVEVLKGPSASALYGSDAANGVIIVTTKRGRPGPPRWSIAANLGMTTMPSKWPTSTYKWTTPLHGGYPQLCIGYCGDATIDSVVHFQALNEPRLTAIGRGLTMGASATVSGGSSTIAYSFSGTGSRERGLLKLPEIEKERYLRYHGEPAPGWMQRPDLLEQRGVQGRVDVQLASDAKIVLSSVLNQQVQRRTSMSSSNSSAIDQLQRLWIDQSYLGDVPLLGNPYERVVVTNLNLVNTVQINLRPIERLPITGTFGMNSLTTSTEMSIARGLLTTDESGGVWRGNTKVASGVTGNVYTSIPLERRVTLAAGMSFDRGRTNDQSGALFGIPIDVSDPSVGQDSVRNQFSRNTSDRTSFGWHLEPRLNIRSQFFVMPGFRLDKLSGANALNGLPKLNFSWLASEAPFFPLKNTIQSFRLRAAFGVSGVQPKPGDRTRLYKRQAVQPYLVTDTLYGEMLSLDKLGNTRLSPERGVEFDGGFDAELWNNRLNLEVTYWKKRRIDAIVTNTYGTSVDGGGAILMNVGNIENFGTDLSVVAQLIERREIGANVSVNFSRQQSRVVRLRNDGAEVSLRPQFGGGTQSNIMYVVGYPVEGKWMNPILGYYDLNGDGRLSTSEIIVDAEPRYVGSTEPGYQLAFNPGVTLFGGRLSMTSSISYVRGQMQTLSNHFVGGTRPEIGWFPWESNIVDGPDGFDRYVAMACVRTLCNTYTQIGFMQKTDVLRWQALSINMNLGERAAKWIKARRSNLAIQASNLALWTNYVGVDPNVNAFSGAVGLSDTGQLPQPGEWRLRLTLEY